MQARERVLSLKKGASQDVLVEEEEVSASIVMYRVCAACIGYLLAATRHRTAPRTGLPEAGLSCMEAQVTRLPET